MRQRRPCNSSHIQCSQPPILHPLGNRCASFYSQARVSNPTIVNAAGILGINTGATFAAVVVAAAVEPVEPPMSDPVPMPELVPTPVVTAGGQVHKPCCENSTCYFPGGKSLNEERGGLVGDGGGCGTATANLGDMPCSVFHANGRW